MPEGTQTAFIAQGEDGDPTEDTPPRLTIALAWISARKARDRVLDSSLFVNPAWDILLDLYICHARNRPECVTDVCVASSAPPTTVLRWISILEERGLIVRTADPRDRRRTLVQLSADGLAKMEQALDASIQSDERLGLGRMRLTD